MEADFKLRAGRRTLQAGYFNGQTFKVCEKSAPGMVSPLAKANAYIMISENSSFIAKEKIVKVLPIRFGFNSKNRVSLVSD